MAAATRADLAALLGMDVEDVGAEQAQSGLDICVSIVKSVTRGNGFVNGVPVEDLRAIIMTSAARLWRNPS